MKRGCCNSSLCEARKSLTVFLDELLDERGLFDIDQERNTNLDILRLVYGDNVKVYIVGQEKPVFRKESRLIQTSLYDIFYCLCSNEEKC